VEKNNTDKFKTFIESYLKDIFQTYQTGEATEASYYSHLRNFLEKYLALSGEQTEITIQPRRTDVGIPDFLLKTKKNQIIGYIEAKDITEKNLSYVEDSEQLKRYRDSLPNLILTNFYEFRLYRNGIQIANVELANPVFLKLLKPPVLIPQNIEKFMELLAEFFSFVTPRVYKAKNLATELANRTRFMTAIIKEELDRNTKSLIDFYQAFKEELIESLTFEKFADMYAQTISYGLFAARVKAKNNDFSRDTAYRYIPPTIPLLRKLFYFLTGPDLPESVSWIVDDITNVLTNADISSILNEFHDLFGVKDDPIIHFYETFLTVLNPQERKKLGVYYTPVPVVSYIIRSVHKILKRDFAKNDGLADRTVILLDPAAGTLTFPTIAIHQINEELKQKGKDGLFNALVTEHILKNFYAFELLIAPYAIGHLKISMVLDDHGYKMKDDERFQFYLTNTLETKELREFSFLPDLAIESKKAKEIKEKIPVLVVVGNPPYSVSSKNKSDFIEKLMEDYKKEVRGERSIQPLSDDYIKFIRFAQWKIEQTGKGVVGIISNNSYLSGLIHRGMRKQLLDIFDDIYILNLHGSARIGETSPDGTKDENVFDIMQGVAIAIFVKKGTKEKSIHYADIYGTRELKYQWLKTNDIETTRWKKIKPAQPYYFFILKEFKGKREYQKFWPLTEIFDEYSSGVKTRRDHLLVDFTPQKLLNKLKIFTGNLPDELVAQSLKVNDTPYWKIKEIREKVKATKISELIYSYSYRPFDMRYIYYNPEIIERGDARFPLMKHLLAENIAIVTTRRTPTTQKFSAFVADSIGDIHLIGDQNYYFPLYLYQDVKLQKKKSNPGNFMLVFDEKEKYKVKKPNFKQKFLEHITNTYKKKIAPEDIFNYIYAILYAPLYREQYIEFLKIDFPRIPFTSDYKVFERLSDLGGKLIELHLLKSPLLNNPCVKFPVKGNDRIGKISYDPNSERVYINDKQYFEGISRELWEYYIGSYQVLEKWLKDRRERVLSLDEINHYFKILIAIKNTIEIQSEINKMYLKIENKITKVSEEID